MAQGRAEIRALLERHGHRPNKALGQHFLVDPNVVDRIVRTAAVGPGDNVVEVGAGTGTLTLALAATGARVVAYEGDFRFDRVLRWAEGTACAKSAVSKFHVLGANPIDMSTQIVYVDRSSPRVIIGMPPI